MINDPPHCPFVGDSHGDPHRDSYAGKVYMSWRHPVFLIACVFTGYTRAGSDILG